LTHDLITTNKHQTYGRAENIKDQIQEVAYPKQVYFGLYIIMQLCLLNIFQ